MLRPSQVLQLARASRSRLLRSSSAAASPLSVVAKNDGLIRCPQRNEWRNFHSTPYFLKDDAAAAGGDDDEDGIPPWQNPLHHNNPDMIKQFAEDFAEGEEMPVLPLPPFEEEEGKTLAPPHVHDLAHEIVNLSLLELRELTTKIADHFGFDDDMMAASYGGGAMAAGPAAGAAEEVVEEKTIFDLKLVGFDAKAKIKVIKEVRAISGLGLKEAKEMVESAPKVLQKDLKPEKAEELKAQLEAVGAQVEIV